MMVAMYYIECYIYRCLYCNSTVECVYIMQIAIITVKVMQSRGHCHLT